MFTLEGEGTESENSGKKRGGSGGLILGMKAVCPNFFCGVTMDLLTFHTNSKTNRILTPPLRIGVQGNSTN